MKGEEVVHFCLFEAFAICYRNRNIFLFRIINKCKIRKSYANPAKILKLMGNQSFIKKNKYQKNRKIFYLMEVLNTTSSINTNPQNDKKFQKITQLHQPTYEFGQNKIFQDVIKKCYYLSEQILKLNSCSIAQTKYNLNQFGLNGVDKINQSQVKPKVKTTNILSTTKSFQSYTEQKNLLYRGRNNSTLHFKFMSKKSDQNLNSKQNFSNSLLDLKNFQSKDEKKDKKMVKKVRLKVNSFAISNNQIKNIYPKKCIPLYNYKLNNKDIFFQNAYRLRKIESVKYPENLDKIQENTKNHIQNSSAKSIKNKLLAYDFKDKKINFHSQLEVNINTENKIETLQKYNLNKINSSKLEARQNQKKLDLQVQKSIFLNNFQNMNWNPNISQIKSKDLMQNQINKNSCKQALKQICNGSKNNFQQQIEKISQNQITNDLKKSSEYEKLLLEYNKIKNISFNDSIKQKSQIEFSKYVKIKQIQQKKIKSKSCNTTSKNSFFSLFSPLKKQIISDNLKKSCFRGPQKIIVNKKQFKEYFCKSLKTILPVSQHDYELKTNLFDQQKEKPSQSLLKSINNKYMFKLAHSKIKFQTNKVTSLPISPSKRPNQDYSSRQYQKNGKINTFLKIKSKIKLRKKK